MSGQATLEVTEARLANAISRFSEDVSTVTGSSVDVNELIERSQKEGVPLRRPKFKKMGKLAKMIILFVMLALIAGVGVFCLEFFGRSVQCVEGEFKDGSGQCFSCPTGCLRCTDAETEKCTKCDLNMYLVIKDEEDKEGICMVSCRGRVIRVGVCVS
jgi:hypothetical protein